MGSRPEYEESRQIEELSRRAERPRLLYCPLTWQVYGRSADGPELLRTVHDLHVLIDRVSGRRLVVHDHSLDGDLQFCTLADDAELVPLVYSITEPQLEAVLDEQHRVVAAFGGEGGGKTQAHAFWHIRTWLRLGGAGVRLWWVAPSLEQTRIAVEKLCTGEDQQAPLVPEQLLLRWPPTERAGDQAIVWLDGTRSELRYAGKGPNAGGNLKGRRPRAIGVDEACEIRPVRLWKILRGRVTRARHLDDDDEVAQIFLSSTPEEGHWAEREIVARVDAGEETEAVYVHLTQYENPWVPLADIEAAIEAKGGVDDPQVQRDVFGRWASSSDRAYARFSVRRSCKAFDTLDDLGLDDVTAAVLRERWPNLRADISDELAGGQDFNFGLLVTELARFGVPKGRPYRSEADLVLVVVDEHATQQRGFAEHGHELAERFGLLAISCDSTGAQTGAASDPKAGESLTLARRLARAGHQVLPCGYSRHGEPANPPVIDSIEQINELSSTEVDGIPRLIVHRRCRRLLDGLQLVKRGPDGRFAKKAGDAQDRLSAAPDALRYLAARALPGSLRDRNDKQRRRT